MEIISTQIKNGEVKRADLNITTSGSSVIAKLLQGSGISLTSTGADAGTGDVTISATGTTLVMGAIGSVPNANAATISAGVLNLQPASASFGGLVTPNAQDFGSGQKAMGSVVINFIQSLVTQFQLKNGSGNINYKFNLVGVNSVEWPLTGFTTNRIHNLPDADGTYVLSVNGIAPNSAGNVTVAAGVGSGITRSIINISAATTGAAAANTDYVYLTTGTFPFTLPTAVGNTNRYTLKVTDGGTITLATTAGQTVDNVTPGLVTFPTSLDFVSNNSNWFII